MAEKMLRVDWMNVLLGDRADGQGNEIRLAEFSVGEEFQRWAVLVSF